MNDQLTARRVRPGAEPKFSVDEFVARERAALARFAAHARSTERHSRLLLADWQTLFDQYERGSAALPAVRLRTRVRIFVTVLIALVRWHAVERWLSGHLLLTMDGFLAVEEGRLARLVEKARGDDSRHTEDDWYHRLFTMPAGPSSQ